jgi:hypothetical protein
VVKALPHLLKARYGSQDYYSRGQVKTAAGLLKLKPKALSYAFALACIEDDFLDALPYLESEAYRTMRRELARLFHVDEADLTCRRLTSKFANPVGLDESVTSEAAYLGSNPGGSGD